MLLRYKGIINHKVHKTETLLFYYWNLFIGFIFKTCLFLVLHTIAQIVVVRGQISARDRFGLTKLDLSAEFAVFGQISPIFDPDNPQMTP